MNTDKTPAILKLADVDKEFQEPSGVLRVLNKVRLTVRRGEIVMLTGPSGSGKTTLLQIAGCLIRPTAGRVEMVGNDLSQASEARRLEVRRQHLGFVFQSFHLLAALTVFDNVALAQRLRRQKIDPERIEKVLTTLGIGSKARKYPQHLSGGEKQRVAIARALIGLPDLLLADEPTSQLDSNSAATVGGLLRQAAKEFNMAVLVTTHDPRLGDIADRKVELKAGVLCA
jgi:putative ABC transport system ATP-binding protein